MKRGVKLGLMVVLFLGCSGDDETGQDTDTPSGTEGTETGSTDTTAQPTSAGDSSSSTAGPSTSGNSTIGETQTSGETTSGTGSESSTGGSSTGGVAGGCLDDAPASWLLCETFDEITDPATEISQWNSLNGTFAVEPGPSVSGDQSLRIRLIPGQQFGGWVTMRFGVGPDAPVVQSPTAEVEAVWARWWLRTQDGWPGRQIGDIGELLVLNAENWAIASDLNIQGDPNLRVHPFAWSCISGGTLQCDGQNDWGGTLQGIWNGAGQAQWFDAGHAGQWLCMEAYMELNTSGQSDGVAEVYVDGQLQIARSDLNWRGTWTEYGINAVRFTAYAAPPQEPLDFHIDDVVVATERVGCE